MKDASTTRPAVRAAAVQGVGRVATLAIYTATFSLIARATTEAAFGAFSAALALHMIGAAIAEFGLTQTLVVERGRGASDGDVLAHGLDATLRLTVIAVLLSGVAAIGLLDDDARRAFLWLLPWFVVSRARAPLGALHQYHLRAVRMTTADVAGRAFTMVMVVALVTQHSSLGVEQFSSIAVAMLAGEIVSIVLLRRGTPRVGTPRTWLGCGRPTLRRALPLGLTFTASMVHARVDQLVLGAFDRPVDLARYAVSYRIVDALGALTVALGTVSFPVLVRARTRDGEGSAPLVIAAAVVVGLVGSAAMFVGAPLLLAIVGGDRYANEVGLTRLLAPVVGIAAVNTAVAQIAIVHDRQRALLRLTVAFVVVNVGLNLALVPAHGARGSAVATLLTEAAGAVLVTVIVARTASTHLHVPDLWWPLAAIGVPFAAFGVLHPLGAGAAWAAYGVVAVFVLGSVARRLRRAVTVRTSVDPSPCAVLVDAG